MPGLDDIPEQTSSGRLMIVARIKVHSGEESRFEELITTSKAEANSDNEPSTFTYRATRVLNKSGKPTGEYILFEEYTGKAGFLEHAQRPSSIATQSSNVILSLDLEFGDVTK